MSRKTSTGANVALFNPASAVLTFVEALLEVDTGATWEVDSANEVVVAAANFSSLMNDEGYISLDDANDEVDLLAGKYLCTLNLIFVNDSATVPSEIGVAVVSPDGLTVHLLVEDIGLLGDSADAIAPVGFSWAFMIDASADLSISIRAAARTASGTLSLDASSSLSILRLGN
jgi:hypothetical protein